MRSLKHLLEFCVQSSSELRSSGSSLAQPGSAWCFGPQFLESVKGTHVQQWNHLTSGEHSLKGGHKVFSELQLDASSVFFHVLCAW